MQMIKAVQPNTTVAVAPAICVKGLRFEYQSGTSSVRALDNIDLEIRRGEFISLVGPSGCGKSTLLYIIGGFVPYRTGDITINGKKLMGSGPDRGIVFQQFALFPWKTVLSNVLYGMEKQRVPRDERMKRARDLIRAARLEGFEDHYPSQLSGGMQQRAAIARTLAVNPDILLMDEPFGALDAQTRSIMQEQLKTIWQTTQKTVLFVTHDVREAVYLSERVAIMSKRPGRIKEIVDTRFPKRSGMTTDRRFDEAVSYIWEQVSSEFEDRA